MALTAVNVTPYFLSCVLFFKWECQHNYLRLDISIHQREKERESLAGLR